MFRIGGIIEFQTKKSNLERDLRKETDIKWVTKGNRKFTLLNKMVLTFNSMDEPKVSDHSIISYLI